MCYQYKLPTLRVCNDSSPRPFTPQTGGREKQTILNKWKYVCVWACVCARTRALGGRGREWGHIPT